MLTGSEGRRGIVRRAGLPWLMMNSSFDESGAARRFGKNAIKTARQAAEYCAYLSAAKNDGARNVFKNAALITADTVVFHNKLLEKPETEAGVYEMIGGLNGNPHEVVTAVTISGVRARRLPDGVFNTGNEIINFYTNDSMGVAYVGDVMPEEGERAGAPVTFAAVSRVLLSGVTRELIKRTIDEENPYACSGGYTIDGILNPYFKILSGTEENIIGLPLSEILTMLKSY